MGLSQQVRDELTGLLQAYLAGSCAIDDVLDFEVEYWGDDALPSDVQDDLTLLSLRGNEVLMGIRPLENFEDGVREILMRTSPPAVSEAAAGS